MKTKQTNLIKTACTLALAGVASAATAAPLTGFEETAGGTYDYNDTNFWVGGVINGIWESGLTVAADQTLTFGADTSLGSGLFIDHTATGNGAADLIFRSLGTADRTLTLGGDVTVTPGNNQTITIGGTAANQNLHVALGGNRTITVEGGDALRFNGNLTGGNITMAGSGSMVLGGIANLSGGSIVASGGGALNFNSGTNGNTGATRAASVTLNDSQLTTNGNSTVASTESVTGAITLSVTSRGRLPTLSLNTGTFKNKLSAANVVRGSNNAVALVRGANLGTNPIASGAGTNIVLGTGPSLIGGGGVAGSTNISIVPWMVGGTTTSDTGSTFVTYDSTSGLRPLSTVSEFASSVGVQATDNVRLTASAPLNADATVNALILVGNSSDAIAADLTAGGGTLTVTSGAILLGQNTNVAAPIDFGAAEGIIGFQNGLTFTGSVAGSGGLTIYTTRESNDQTFVWSAASTYTGDTNMISPVWIGGANVLPNGARTGNVNVISKMDVRATYTINGLNGSGEIAGGGSNTVTLTFGDNNADGEFTGTFTDFGTLNLVKIGDGTQKLTGSDSTNQGSTTIRGGVLEVSTLADGAVASSIGNRTSTAASGLVINGGTLKYVGGAADIDKLFQIGETTSGGIGTIDASGTGALRFENTAAIGYGTAGTTGTPQTRTLVLTGTNTGDNTIDSLIGNNGTATNGNSAVALSKTGAGNWILTNTNTYTGGTSVSAGTLLINGSIASGAAVSGSGTLGGTGTIAGNVTVAPTASLAPGASIESLGVSSNVTLAGKLFIELDGNGAGAGLSDLLQVGGTFDIAGGTVNFATLSPLNDPAYVFATYGTLPPSTTFVVVQNLPSGYAINYAYEGNQIALVAVPEPAAMGVLAAGAMLLAGRRRRI